MYVAINDIGTCSFREYVSIQAVNHKILLGNLAIVFKQYKGSDLYPTVLPAVEMGKKCFEVLMVNNRHLMDLVHKFVADSAVRACGITTAHFLETTERAAAREAQKELASVIDAAVEK